MKNVTVIDHPLVQHHLTRLRDRQTKPADFRANIRRLATLTAYEATRDLGTRQCTVETPLETARGLRIFQRIAVLTILRAGLGMVDPILDLIPEAEVWHLGIYRDEATLQPVEYYQKLPDTHAADVALVLDPMLATGGSLVAALDAVRRWGVPRTKVLAIIAAPEGIRYLTARHPDASIYVCAVDRELNEHAYIIPGLGDAGDRAFNTSGV